MTVRELMQSAPDKHATAELVLDWLEECGLADSGRDDRPRVGPLSIFAFAEAAEDGIGFMAVPDDAISADARAALDAPWAKVFATEEITHAGQLWMLAFTGSGDGRIYEWQGSNVGVAVEALLEVHRRARASAWVLDDRAALRGVVVTACYVARLAH